MTTAMMRATGASIASAARAALGSYELYRIFVSTTASPRGGGDAPRARTSARANAVDSSAAAPIVVGELGGVGMLVSATAPELRALAAYGGRGARVFVACVGGELAGAACYWDAERYRARGFWPLRDGELKLVQITVAEAYRGRGVASGLIRASAAALHAAGAARLFARVWHSHRASRTAFERGGWRPHGWALGLRIAGRRRVWRWRRGAV